MACIHVACVRLKEWLDLFYGEADGDGTLGSQEENPLNFTPSIKFMVKVSENAFPHDTIRTHFPLIT